MSAQGGSASGGKIIILGSKGNLGTQLVEVFSEDKSNKITAWDRGDIDITDKDLIIKKINDIKPDVIINAVAYNAVDVIEDDADEFEKAKKINGEAVGYLAETAIENDCLLIHFSSDYVFDGKKEDGYREDDEPSPISKYGETKLMGEKELISRSGKGLKYYLIRTSKLFGPKGDSENSKPSFFDLILRSSKNKREFNMVHGEEISCFTYTFDLAREVKKLIESEKSFGIYHIINEEPASWYDGAKYMFELLGIADIKLNPCKMEDYSRSAKRPKFSILKNTKLKPLRDWKSALKDYLK